MKKGKSFQYATLTQYIFEHDSVQANGYTAKPKMYLTSIEKFNNYQLAESACLEERCKHKYDLNMAQASNKHLKYEFKLKNAEAKCQDDANGIIWASTIMSVLGVVSWGGQDHNG